MKNLLLSRIPFLLLFISTAAWCQEKVVTGKVTSKGDGLTVPGVNIVLKGTTNGTVTDADGNFRITVPAGGGLLVFSFIGMTTQEVEIGDHGVIDVQLDTDVKQLGEVVVTALGISQNSKSLGYSVTKLNNEDVTQARTSSVLSSMQGKIAGVQISGSSGAPGSSNKVIIRGFTSLSGGNNPLYIIDGIPVNSAFSGTTGLNSAADFGGRINDLNAEDVESLTVLKGAAATVLYGSRAASGVIIITTKKGKDAAARGKKAEITVASSVMFENILKLPDWQNQFGEGFFNNTPQHLNENTSWGSPFDGQNHVWGRVVNNEQRVKPFVALPNNVKDFFETGRTYTNSVSMQGGNAQSSYYLSYANVNGDGIMPTSADSYKRNTLSVRGSTTLANRVTSSASLNYARTNTSFVPTGQATTVYNNLLQTPRDIPIRELADINNQFNDLEGYYSPYTTNPYYALKKFGSTAVIDRIYGNVELGYKATDWLGFTARIGSDVSTTTFEAWAPKNHITGPNAPTESPGNYSVQNDYNREFNTDLLMNINKNVGTDFNISGLVGWNVNQRQTGSQFSQINDLVIPDFYNLTNTANTPTSTYKTSLRRLIGLYSQATITYRNYLYMSISARNDWSSTLPAAHRSFFYPSINMGLDLTSALKIDNRALSYAKLRGAVSQVGKDAAPYQINSVYVQSTHTDGFINLNSPLAQSIPAFQVGNTIGNPRLQPEISTEVELGLDVKFFNNRLGLDATVYQRNVKDNILTVPLAASSGYSFQVLNIAKLQNRGLELLLTGTPVLSPSFRWDVSINWSKNVSKIVDLGGPSQITVGGLGGTAMIARVGRPAFEVEGAVPWYDAQGHIVVNNGGLPVNNPVQQVLGNTQYHWIGGITNKISYKGISLSATFDVRNGGIMYSRSATLVYFAGTTPATTYNNRNPFVVPNSGVQVLDANNTGVVDEHGLPVTTPNTTPILNTDGQQQAYWSAGGNDLARAFMVSKSYVKLREVVLSYSLPKEMLSRTPFGRVDLSLIGRNLLLWLPKNNVFIDPEQTTFGTDIGSEFGEFGATPTTRSYGFNVRLTF